MVSDATLHAGDPLLARALRDKRQAGHAGRATSRRLAGGAGWQVVDVLCTAGPDDRPFEERQETMTISLVRTGTFTCRSDAGSALLSAGSWLVLSPQQGFECGHAHGEGDRCLSFQFEPWLFERLAHEAGAPRPRFVQHRLPPLRRLAPLTARALAADDQPAVLEEVALALAGDVAGLAADAPAALPARGAERIAPLLRRMEATLDAPHALGDLAREVGLSPYHFLRVFTAVTGVTPHQWLLRSRLRRAAGLLAATRRPITAIALDVGFQDLSNFIRTFRTELGVSPRQYRQRAAAAR